MKNALVLCSGGLDSVTTAYFVKKKLRYDKIKILFFNYKQRNLDAERKCSMKCASDLGGEFLEIPLEWLGNISTSLLNSNEGAEKLKKENLKDTKKESDKWYVPCRNTLFLVHALALAESLKIKEKERYDIFTGFKCEGKESYPDTTKEFVEEMNKLSSISCTEDISIIAPLIEKDKEDIVLLGKELGVDFRKTFSCYTGEKIHCGTCLACRLRQEGFYWANVKDETEYKN